MAQNETGIPQTFSLGECIYPQRSYNIHQSLGSVDEEDQFEAFVRFTATP